MVTLALVDRGLIILVVFCGSVRSHFYDNYTRDAASRQIDDFKKEHPFPIGLKTTSHGEPIEIRKTITRNSDLFANHHHFDLMTHIDSERIPERVVHAKGSGAYGYFEVTHDVSKYTSADVFNRIGKKTPLNVRFSRAAANLGGSDVGHDMRGMAIKFYTKEGNLDLLGLSSPVYFYRDPLDFAHFVRAVRRNPQTNLADGTMTWDFLTLKPVTLHAFLWINSDYGSPNGYRTMEGFPIHTYEVNNKHGDRYYVKFNFRSEQGLDNTTAAVNQAINGEDPDYFSRDLYNAIDAKNYPAWRLELDILTIDDLKHLDYNPFDVARLWKKGTYKTVPVGRLVLNKKVDNNFKDAEQAAYNPGNLVPGIPGPVDFMFKSRRFSYRDAQNHRLGVNHNKIEVNRPKYDKGYNRDGPSPVLDNMMNVPNYYPNTFSGPIPYVDGSKPKENLIVLEQTAVDLEPASYFYNHIVESDAHRQRIAANLATSLLNVSPKVVKRSLELLHDVDKDLGNRVTEALKENRWIAAVQPAEERFRANAQCFTQNTQRVLEKVKNEIRVKSKGSIIRE